MACVHSYCQIRYVLRSNTCSDKEAAAAYVKVLCQIGLMVKLEMAKTRYISESGALRIEMMASMVRLALKPFLQTILHALGF